ncbi:MAG: flippase [Fibrobacter sp.]|nr:flippase [Fibrobacter sp.]
MKKLHKLWQNFTNSEEKKALWTNFFSLSTIQAFGYALPLLTIPYVVRVVGTELYGTAAFALAVAAFFTVIVDYGFNLTATREASINRSDMGYLSQLYAAVMSVKFILLLLGFSVLMGVSYLFPEFGGGFKILIAAYSVVLGQALFPAWLFQGLERMRAFTLFSVIPRILAAAAVFILIKKPADVFWVPALQGLGGIVSGLLGIIVAWKSLGLRLVRPTLSLIKSQLKNGWPVFLSNFGINTYINSNIVILGLVASPSAVGFYAVAEKLVSSVRGVLVILFQSIYPRACLRAHKGKSLQTYYKKIILMSALLFGTVALLMWFFAPQIIWLISGKYVPQSATVLKILAFVPVIVLLNIPPYQMLLMFKRNSELSFLVIAGAIFNISLNILLSRWYFEVGTAITVLITELIITLGFYIIYWRKNIMSIFHKK